MINTTVFAHYLTLLLNEVVQSLVIRSFFFLAHIKFPAHSFVREVDVFCAIGGSVSPLRFSFDKWNFTLESRQTREWKQTQNEPSVKLLFLFRLTYGITNRLSLQSKEKKIIRYFVLSHFLSNFFHRISIFHNFPHLALVPLVTTECLREHIKSMVKLFIISKQQQNNTQQPKRRTVSNDDKHIENMKNRIVIVIRISWPTLGSSSGKHEKKTDKTKHSNFRTMSLQLSVALNQPCLYSKWFVFSLQFGSFDRYLRPNVRLSVVFLLWQNAKQNHQIIAFP